MKSHPALDSLALDSLVSTVPNRLLKRLLYRSLFLGSTALVVAGLGAIAPSAQALSFITERSQLGATDQVNWETLGPVFSPFGPPDPAVFLNSPVTATSEAGLPVQVDIPPATTPGVFPPFVFQTTPEPGIATNFGNGDFILFTGLIPGPPPAVGNPGPLSLTFAEPIFGAGAQLAVDDIFNFTATISAFDQADQLLGSFSTPGTSSVILDNSAVFLGVLDEQPSISRLEFSSSIPNSAIGINQLSLVASAASTEVPEPTSAIALGLMAVLGLKTKSLAKILED